MNFRSSSWVLLGGLLASSIAPAVAAAQINYPSFQPPQVVDREFNFAIADARRTTTLVFQWREGVATRSQLSFDAGFTDVEGPDSDLLLVLGGQYAYQMVRSGGDNPLDLLFTAGVFLRMGEDDRSAMSVPFGVSLGHRFVLDGPLALTPYVHPRISIDMFNNESDLNINFDIGANFEINNRIALRFSAALGEADAIGFSLAWRPQGVRR
jgi:hypothetical protein